MTLSIIIPAYNGEDTIEKCITSIFCSQQRYPSILEEVIIVNDGSTDNTLKKIQEIQLNFPLIKIINQKNKGAGGARNTGIKIAKSEYISFIDSDDSVDMDYLSPLLFNSNDIIKFKISKKNKQNQFTTINSDIGPIPSAFYKKNIFIKNNLFFPEGINYEDNAIGFNLFNITEDKISINDVLYYYAFTEGSQSNSQSLKHAKDRIASIDFLITEAKRLGIYNKFKHEFDEKAFTLAYLPTISLCFRHWGNYKTVTELKSKLSHLEIALPSNTPFKQKAFYFCMDKLGYLGYILICIKRINKIFR